jgi:hypothetical protein
MKQCPKCQQFFSDENLFCLSDGTQLVFEVPEEVTVVKPFSFIRQPLQPTTRQGVSPMFAYLVVGLLALALGGAVVLWLKSDFASSNIKSETQNIISNSAEPKTDKDRQQLNEQKRALQEELDLLEKEKQKLANEQKKLESRKIKPVDSTYTSVSQPTARINFRKGNLQSTTNGSVFGERSFVLRANSGQYLSANVSSGNGCVAFGNGTTSTSYTTIKGDNRITIVNTCGGQSSFSLTVYIR